jgi:hypothetical protein
LDDEIIGNLLLFVKIYFDILLELRFLELAELMGILLNVRILLALWIVDVDVEVLSDVFDVVVLDWLPTFVHLHTHLIKEWASLAIRH